MAHTTVYPAKFWHLDVELGSWALSMLGRCPHNYFAPTAQSRCAPDCLSNQQLQKTAGCRVNFSRWQNCLWRCHARCLRGLQQHGHWAIVLGFFTPAHISIIRLSWPFSCVTDNIYKDAYRYKISSSFLAQVFL